MTPSREGTCWPIVLVIFHLAGGNSQDCSGSTDFGINYNGVNVFSVVQASQSCVCTNYASPGRAQFNNASIASSLTVGSLAVGTTPAPQGSAVLPVAHFTTKAFVYQAAVPDLVSVLPFAVASYGGTTVRCQGSPSGQGATFPNPSVLLANEDLTVTEPWNSPAPVAPYSGSANVWARVTLSVANLYSASFQAYLRREYWTGSAWSKMPSDPDIGPITFNPGKRTKTSGSASAWCPWWKTALTASAIHPTDFISQRLLLQLDHAAYTVPNAGPVVCAVANENANLVLTCPAGFITSVVYAYYGTSTGSCAGGHAASSCNSATSFALVSGACKGLSSCTIAVSNAWNTYDPCAGPAKWLAAKVQCGFSLAAGLAAYPNVNAASNLALGRPTSQSSLCCGGIYPSFAGVDGNLAATNFFHTNPEANAWWQVDLGAVYPIGDITLVNRQDCCQTRLGTFYVFASTWNMGAGTPSSILATVPAPNFWELHSYTEMVGNVMVVRAGAARARFIRIQLAGTEHLHLTEVVVQLAFATNVYQTEVELHASESGAAQTFSNNAAATGNVLSTAFTNFRDD